MIREINQTISCGDRCKGDWDNRGRLFRLQGIVWNSQSSEVGNIFPAKLKRGSKRDGGENKRERERVKQESWGKVKESKEMG